MSAVQRLERVIQFCIDESEGRTLEFCESIKDQLKQKGFLTEKQMSSLHNVSRQLVWTLSNVSTFEEQLGPFLKSKPAREILKLCS